MFQILVAVAVLFAAVAALAASHRVGHRQFVRVSGGIAALALVALVAMVWDLARPPALAPVESVTVEVRDAHRVEVGYRLELLVSNQGSENTRQLQFAVQLLGCSEAGDTECQPRGSDRVNMPMHVPPGGEYPLSRILSYDPLPEGEQPAWKVTVEQVQVYR